MKPEGAHHVETEALRKRGGRLMEHTHTLDLEVEREELGEEETNGEGVERWGMVGVDLLELSLKMS